MQRWNILSLLTKGFCCYLALQIAVAFSEPLITENQYGPIQPGDILWNIALKIRPDSSINQYQMMFALFQANPDSFKISCNVNSLIVGKMLVIPPIAKIQAINSTRAKNIIDQQNSEWRNYRHQNRPIHCPPLPVTAEPVESLPIPVPQNESSTRLSTNTKKIAVETSSSQKTPAQNSWTTFWPSLLDNPISLAVVIFIVAFLLFLVILTGRLFRHLVRKLIPVKPQQHQDSPEKSSFSSPSSEMSGEIVTSTEPQKSQENLETMINKKLDTAREHLAKGETQTAKILLQNIIDQGNQNQRREARQLFEINQQMSTLELNLLQVQRMTTSPLEMDVKTKPVVTQTVPPLSSAISTQQYLPENKAEIFNLVDKILMILDQELDAKGKLIEAYRHRHQPELFSADECKIMKKPEKILVEQETTDTFQQSSRGAKTIRYL